MILSRPVGPVSRMDTTPKLPFSRFRIRITLILPTELPCPQFAEQVRDHRVCQCTVPHQTTRRTNPGRPFEHRQHLDYRLSCCEFGILLHVVVVRAERRGEEVATINVQNDEQRVAEKGGPGCVADDSGARTGIARVEYVRGHRHHDTGAVTGGCRLWRGRRCRRRGSAGRRGWWIRWWQGCTRRSNRRVRR